jgi:hypothetical protein
LSSDRGSERAAQRVSGQLNRVALGRAQTAEFIVDHLRADASRDQHRRIEQQFSGD